jgi:hypothetical protein
MTIRKRRGGGMVGGVVVAKETTAVEIIKYVHTNIFLATDFNDCQAGRTNPFE